MPIQLPNITAMIRAATEKRAAEHGYVNVRQAQLGDGAGHVVNQPGINQRLVWVRYDTTGAGTNILATAELPYSSTIPYSDQAINPLTGTNYDGLYVMVGNPPGVLGGKGVLHVVKDNAGVAGQLQIGQANPVWQGINNPANLTFSVVDGSLNVAGVKQVIVPTGALVNNGGGSVSLNFATSAVGGGGTSFFLLPATCTSGLQYQTTANNTVNSTPAILNFNFFQAAFGTGASSQVVTGASWKFTAPITALYFFAAAFSPAPPGSATYKVQTASRSYLVGGLTANPGQIILQQSIYLAVGETASLYLSAVPNWTIYTGALIEIGWNDPAISANLAVNVLRSRSFF